MIVDSSALADARRLMWLLPAFESALCLDADDPLPVERVFGAGRLPDAAYTRALQEAIVTPTAKHDLLLFFNDRQSGSEFMLEFDADLLDRATAERWLAYLEQFASMAVQTEESE
jgi:hypothetical protein